MSNFVFFDKYPRRTPREKLSRNDRRRVSSALKLEVVVFDFGSPLLNGSDAGQQITHRLMRSVKWSF
jgi:hypothetical protein